MSTRSLNTDGFRRIKKEQPIHKQLYQILREPIMSGSYSSGSKLPTEAELIKMHGVSRITVRRALQELAAEGLIQGKKGQGTFVRAGANIIAKRRYLFIDSDSLAVNYPYTQKVLQGIRSKSQNLEFRLEILARNHDPNDTIIAELLESADFDGLIALSTCLTVQEAHMLEKKGLPLVLLGHMYEKIELGPKMVNIICRSEDAISKIFGYFLDHGRRNIGFIGKPLSEYQPHLEIVKNVCEKAGLIFKREHYEPSDYGIKPAIEACARLLKNNAEIQAILTHDDLQAIGVIQYLNSIGKRIPLDIAVIGNGNFVESESHEITTIDSGISEQGRLAVQTLDDLINGKEVDRQIEIPAVLVIRKTA